MKGDMIMNTPSGTLKSRVFRPWDLYRVTGSPSAWHRPSWSSPCNCKLDLDKAFIYALSPQASTTTEQFIFYVCICNLFAFARVIPTGDTAVFMGRFKGRHLEVMGKGYERGPPASWAERVWL